MAKVVESEILDARAAALRPERAFHVLDPFTLDVTKYPGRVGTALSSETGAVQDRSARRLIFGGTARRLRDSV